MATIKCPNCGNEISKETELCVYCGHDLTAYSKDQLDLFENEQFKENAFYSSKINYDNYSFKDYYRMRTYIASISLPIVGIVLAVVIVILAIALKAPVILFSLIVSFLMVLAGIVIHFATK